MNFNLYQPFVTSVIRYKITCQSRHTLQVINVYPILKLERVPCDNFMGYRDCKALFIPTTMEELSSLPARVTQASMTCPLLNDCSLGLPPFLYSQCSPGFWKLPSGLPQPWRRAPTTIALDHQASSSSGVCSFYSK